MSGASGSEDGGGKVYAKHIVRIQAASLPKEYNSGISLHCGQVVAVGGGDGRSANEREAGERLGWQRAFLCEERMRWSLPRTI